VETRNLLVAVAVLVAAVAVGGCGGASDEKGEAAASGGSGEKGTLSLVAYSTPQVVYDELIPAFSKTPEGNGIGFKTSFGASGDQARAVEAGQEADVVTFSTEPDMTRLVDAGIVDPSWKQNEHKGLVTTSVVSFVVRKGNPKNIRTWEDLLEPGVEVLTPNPFSSCAAKWNLLAGYGYASDGGKNPQAGLDYVRELITEHVKVQDKSGREALQNFLGGNGDVLLSYEYEAITANKNGEELEYVIPDDTIKIDIDIATTKDAPPAAQAFVDYALSEPAQEKFAEWGYRPVNEAVLKANESRTRRARRRSAGMRGHRLRISCCVEGRRPS
jgi:sulfate/thiosulfate transport system substrate-binding protein